MLGSVPRGARTVQGVKLVGVSVKKEDRTKLSPSNQLKLSEKAREGGSYNFVVVQANTELGSYFNVVYNLYTRIEAIAKALVL